MTPQDGGHMGDMGTPPLKHTELLPGEQQAQSQGGEAVGEWSSRGEGLVGFVGPSLASPQHFYIFC